MSNSDVVGEFYAAFDSQDAAAADRLMADEFRFTSPQDDHIDKAEWLRRCFPTREHFASRSLLAIEDIGGDDVVLYYEYALASGETYRNAEVLTVRDDRVVATRVFFGGRER